LFLRITGLQTSNPSINPNIMAKKSKTPQVRGIVPKKIKGFRDIDPSLNQLKQQIVQKASAVYQLYGFEHWDTPILEYADSLGKYMPDVEVVDQGVYSFRSPELESVYDTEGRELKDENGKVVMENHFLAMRYDLTAPLARKYSEDLLEQWKRNQLTQAPKPLLKRFQFGPVFRYEIKLAPGRFREFWQLDFDTVGTDDVTVDAECCMILSEALEAIGLARNTYVVKVNNRKILKGLLQSLGVATEVQETAILRVVDKYDKIGIENVRLELGAGRKEESGSEIKGLNLDAALADGICSFLGQFIVDDPTKLPSRKAVLEAIAIDNPVAKEGLEELEKMDNIFTALGFDEARIVFDPTFVRGMAYYTGPIFEVESLLKITDEKGKERRVGSICGGGRYDGLVENLLGIKVPAVGASIGVDRLAALLEMANALPPKEDGPVLVTYLDSEFALEYQKIAAELRAAGIKAETYCGEYRKGGKALLKQLKYADSRNSPVAIMLGGNEFEKGVVSVRNLKKGAELAATVEDKKEWQNLVQKEVKREDLVGFVKGLLA
jgi:histidyl-tRNA synthetase